MIDDDYVEESWIIKKNYFVKPRQKAILLVGSDQFFKIPEIYKRALSTLNKNSSFFLREHQELNEAWLTKISQEPNHREENPETQIAALIKKVKQNTSTLTIPEKKITQESFLLAQKILLKNSGPVPSYPILAFWVAKVFLDEDHSIVKNAATIFAKYASFKNLNTIKNQVPPELFTKVLNIGKRELQNEKKISFEIPKNCSAFANGEELNSQNFWVPKSLPTVFSVSCPDGFYSSLIDPQETYFIPANIITFKNEISRHTIPTPEILSPKYFYGLDAKFIVSVYWLEKSKTVQAAILQTKTIKVIKKINFFYHNDQEKQKIFDKISKFMSDAL
ncbi:MAG: hypothetical protein K2X39_08385 [Silvanigrellaceae bacterium]|nr:hypothetical protein [Silvanigrellaceae bacterium]